MENISKMINTPIFLVGAERSGTTVLRLMLNHHPNVAWCHEFEYAVDKITEQGNWPELNNYHDWLSTHRIFQATNFSINDQLSFPELVNDFLIQKHTQTRKTLIGATVHRHFDRLLKIWPDAKFIHIVRDPRDVARSCIGMGWAGNVWTGVELWLEAEKLWDKLRCTISTERIFEIKYESLISDPKVVLNKICVFMGIDYDSEMLSYPKNTTYSFPDPAFIEQWKTKLSTKEIQLVESKTSNLMQLRGYALSGLPTIRVNSWIKKRLRFQDWLKRTQFRVKRNGFYLFISDYLSRRLGLTNWQNQVKIKINAIETSYLK